MNNKTNILKINGYDKFKCTADKCKFTCCEGWDICIDKNTYSKWEKVNDKKNQLLSSVKSKNDNNEKRYYINKGTHDSCPLLDENGLCNIVKCYGEEYLSITCHSFPRMEKEFDNITELSLSCACPEVVEIISDLNENIGFKSENENNIECDLLEVKIRETLIDTIQNQNISLEQRLIISYQMLLEFLETEEELDEDFIIKVLDRYNDRSFFEELTKEYKILNTNKDKAIEEVNNLFLDIIEFYRGVESLREALKDISVNAENINKKVFIENWTQYKNDFNEFNFLLEKCITSKILSSCCSEDVEELVIALQIIILEYILIRYAVFLKYLNKENKIINIEEVKEFVVAFTRIIGNNSGAVLDFLEDGFGDYILEKEYLNFIMIIG